jgi:hypothetical protein
MHQPEMQPDENILARASLLAAELIDICHAAGKPLAGDYIQVAMEQLVAGTSLENVPSRSASSKDDRFHEN